MWWPEDLWEPPDRPGTEVLPGPDTTLLDPADIPQVLPVSRPAGFTARL